jgi:hypothetical protein
MLMLRWCTKILCAGEFVSQAGGFMNENWQTLRADVNFVALKFNGQQGFFLFGLAAIQADTILHRFSKSLQDNKGARVGSASLRYCEW